MANRYMKRYSRLLIIKEIQVKATMRYHLILLRVAISKKTTKKCWCGCREGNPCTVGGNVNWCNSYCCRLKSWLSLPIEAELKKIQSVGEIKKWLSFSVGREGNTVGSCLKNCAPHHGESRGLYKMRAHSQGSVMRNKGFKILSPSSSIV